MEGETKVLEATRPDYRRWMRGSLILIALLVIARFVLEVAGVPHEATRYFSSAAAVFLVAIYLGSVAPARRVMKTAQLIVPAIALAAWTQGWVILMTLLTAVFRLERSHFLEAEELGDWRAIGGHLLGHVVATLALAVLVFVFMAIIFYLRRWPVTLGPGALLGALVVLRFWLEAMGLPDAVTAAMSSTVGILASAVYLGGVASRFGLTSPRHLIGPALALGWVWRFWVFLATLLSALVPFFKTHFFDPSQGQVAWRLIHFFFGGFLLVGLIAGLLIWGIAIWISRATRPSPTT